NGFKITPKELENAIGPRTKVLVINSPSNPAGHAYAPDELKALAEVVAAHPDVLVFSDEIYEKLVYDGLKFVSFATLHPALLDRAHVAVVPGNDSGFDSHVRLSFATGMQQIDKGLDRIAEFLKRIG